MPVTVKNILLRRKEVENQVGSLAHTLEPVTKAGANLHVLMGYRYPGEGTKAAIELYPIAGKKVNAAVLSLESHMSFCNLSNSLRTRETPCLIRTEPDVDGKAGPARAGLLRGQGFFLGRGHSLRTAQQVEEYARIRFSGMAQCGRSFPTWKRRPATSNECEKRPFIRLWSSNRGTAGLLRSGIELIADLCFVAGGLALHDAACAAAKTKKAGEPSLRPFCCPWWDSR